MKTLIQFIFLLVGLQFLQGQNNNYGHGNHGHGNHGHGNGHGNHGHGHGNGHHCVSRCNGGSHFESYFDQVWVPGSWIVNRWGRHWVAAHWDRIERFRPVAHCEPLPPTPVCMNPYDFQHALQSIQNQNFDSSKLTLARQIASTNFLSAQQIRAIMMTFSFESSRMEFAKFAWQNCIDKQNYYQVNDAFQFSSSVEELDRFIRCH